MGVGLKNLTEHLSWSTIITERHLINNPLSSRCMLLPGHVSSKFCGSYGEFGLKNANLDLSKIN